MDRIMITINSKWRRFTAHFEAKRLLLASALIAALSVGTIAAEEERGWLLFSQPAQIAAFDLSSGQVTERFQLEGGKPAALYPTPGGKFIFISYEASAMLATIDTETGAIAYYDDLLSAAPASLTFSPTGQSLYIASEDSSRIDLFQHARARLTEPTTLNIGLTGGSIDFNRRATRLYRSDADGLAFFLRKDHEPIRVIRRTTGPLVWKVGPGYRYLWGVGNDRLIIVDERRARVAKRIDGQFTETAPLFSDSAAYLLSADGQAILSFDTKRFKERRQDSRYCATDTDSTG